MNHTSVKRPLRCLLQKLLSLFYAARNAVFSLLRTAGSRASATNRTHPLPDSFKFMKPSGDEVILACSDTVRYKMDVLVGTLRSSEQLRYCTDTKRYYVPSRVLTGDISNVHHIALYEEGIGTEPGIRFYGEVCSVRHIPRREIAVSLRPNADPGELYFEFAVKEWKLLPSPILLLDTYRGRPRFTSLFLLRHCTRSYQLFEIHSDEDRRLMQLLNRITETMSFADPAPCSAAYSLCEDRLLIIKNGTITVQNEAAKILDRFPIDWLLLHPRAGFVRLRRLMQESSSRT